MRLNPGVQGMRGFAALAVVLSHTGIAVAGWGYIGVDLFFVISGFVLTRKFLDGDYAAPDGKFSPRNYYLKRVFRIWPLYWLSLPLFVVVCALPPSWQMLLFLQNYSLSTFGNLLPTWTICIEEVFYALLPLWVLLFRTRYAIPFTVVLFGIGAFWAGYAVVVAPYGSTLYALILHQFPGFAFEYALGSLVAIGKVPKVRTSWLIALTFAVVAWCAVWKWFVGFELFAGPLFYLWVGNWQFVPLFTHPWVVWLGALAYPIYLFGYPLRYLVGAYLDPTTFLGLVAVVGATIGVAQLLHSFVESPCIELGRRTERWLSGERPAARRSMSKGVPT